jgi:hypothetical protein
MISFQHYNTSYGASYGGDGVVWPYAYLVDVTHGRINKVIQNLCLQHGKVKR